MSKILNNLKVKIFADGASKKDILELNSKDFIKGFTTNPSLMKKSELLIMKDSLRKSCKL